MTRRDPLQQLLAQERATNVPPSGKADALWGDVGAAIERGEDPLAGESELGTDNEDLPGAGEVGGEVEAVKDAAAVTAKAGATKIGAAIFGVVLAGGAAWIGVARAPESTPRVSAPALAQTPEAVPSPEHTPALTVPAPVSAPQSDSAAGRRSTSARPSTGKPDFVEELRLLRRARNQAAAGDHDGARRTLQAYERRFPKGQFRQEQLAELAMAWCRLGQPRRGAKILKRLRREFADAPSVAAAAEVCRSASTASE